MCIKTIKPYRLFVLYVPKSYKIIINSEILYAKCYNISKRK